MQALETLLSTQLAAWHNRHPLARHVRAQDVHTMGVVALPFMRSGPPREPQEPVLGEVGIGAPPPSFTQAPQPGLQQRLQQRLQRLLAWRPGRKAPRERWPVFSEQFVVGLSARQIGEFASRHGYSQRPDDGSWPLRSIPVDETLAAQGPVDGGGAWPEEVFLLSAAIDAGPARTRVLIAQGAGLRLHIRGPRCLHPLKVGLFGLLMALLLGVLLLATLGQKKGPASAGSPAAAASAAASAASGSAAPASAAVLVPAASAAASPPAPAASTTEPLPAPTAASAAASGTDAAPPARPLLSASQLPDTMASAPDIRPHLVTRPEGGGSAPAREAGASQAQAKAAADKAGKDAPKAAATVQAPPTRPTDQIIERAIGSASAPAPARPAPKTERAPSRSDTGRPKDARQGAAAASEPTPDQPSAAETLKQRNGRPSDASPRGNLPDGAPLVALVGPPMASKADAEAYLQKMQPLIQPLIGKKVLEQQVLQTPEGWRAAVWPFASREEAQLINAMLVARGLRTRAVDF